MAIKTKGDRLKVLFEKARKELAEPGIRRDDFYYWMVGMFGRFEAIFDVGEVKDFHLDHAEAALNEKIREKRVERTGQFKLAAPENNCGNCGHSTEQDVDMLCHLHDEMKGLSQTCSDWTPLGSCCEHCGGEIKAHQPSEPMHTTSPPDPVEACVDCGRKA